MLHSQTNSLENQTPTNKFFSESGIWVKAYNTNCLIWNSFPRDGESVSWSGRVVDGHAQGSGVLQWFTNGVPTSRYEGEMKEGRMDGHGITSNHVVSTEGDFKRGLLVPGIVKIHYASGGSYEGEAKDGFKEGQGTEVMAGGVKFVGQFKRDKFDGAGKMIWPNGDTVAGEWKNSQLVGAGTLIRADGESIKVKMSDKGIERY